jgi:hypothetical protein
MSTYPGSCRTPAAVKTTAFSMSVGRDEASTGVSIGAPARASSSPNGSEGPSAEAEVRGAAGAGEGGAARHPASATTSTNAAREPTWSMAANA